MFPLMLMSEQSISHLKDALPGSAIDVRRFRPPIVIDAPLPNDETVLPELVGSGRTAMIGSSKIEFVIACPRCIMVTRAVDDSVGDDRDVLRYVVRELNQDVGVYANIVQPGMISEGRRDRFHVRFDSKYPRSTFPDLRNSRDGDKRH